MKRKGIIFFGSLLLFLFGGIQPVCAQVITYEGEGEAVLMLAVTEYGVKENNAIQMAIKDAYSQILYRGIAASKYNSTPLFKTEDNAQRQYFENLVNGDRLYAFISYCNLYKYKRRNAVVKLSVNVGELISDLEKNNLYRRLGLY